MNGNPPPGHLLLVGRKRHAKNSTAGTCTSKAQLLQSSVLEGWPAGVAAIVFYCCNPETSWRVERQKRSQKPATGLNSTMRLQSILFGLLAVARTELIPWFV